MPSLLTPARWNDETTHVRFHDDSMDTSRGVRDANEWVGGRGDNPYECAWGEYLKGKTLEGTVNHNHRFTLAEPITWDSLPKKMRDKAEKDAQAMRDRSYGLKGGKPFDLKAVYIFWTYNNRWNSCRIADRYKMNA